ncbi:MAG: hypothetical protein ACLFTH_03335 [Candidatus Woesearchaeota archaeon]
MVVSGRNSRFVVFLLVMALSFVLISAFAFASSDSLTVHGRLTNKTGSVLTGTHTITFSIYNQASGGSPLWTSTESVTTDARGVYSKVLTGVDVDFDQDLYLGIRIGSDAEMTPRLEITSSPSSFTTRGLDASINSSHNISIVNNTLFVDTSNQRIGIGTSSPSTALEINGSVNISGSNALSVYEICLDGQCQTSWPSGGGSSGAGWSNSSVTTTETGLNIDVDSGVLYVNASSDRVGINNHDPQHDLDVSGTVAATEVCIDDNCQTSWPSGMATFHNTTSATYTGDMGGYSAANANCDAEFPGSHLCTVDEILNTINAKDVSIISEWAGTAWLAGGPPGYTANANDCKGFTSDSSSNLGKFWDFDDTTDEGVGWMTNCANTKPLACCKVES